MKFKNTLSPVYLSLAVIIGSSIILTGCGEKNSKDQPQQSTQQASGPIISAQVNVFEVKPLEFPVQTTLPGRVIASEIAEIRPQVGGIILKREFEESSNVTEGQSLYQIDPTIYQAQYDSALANVESAKANANIAHLTLKRYENLLKTKAISLQEYDKAAAEAKQGDAAVLVAQASLHTAKVNLDYTKVYSPINGYVGVSNVTEGALVSVGQQTALTLVQKLDPIYIDMTQAATTFEKNQKNGTNIYTPANKVELYLSDGSKYEHDGHIKFSDKSVNQTTGTVTLRAEFPNAEGRILPNMFVKPIYTYGKIVNAILLPQKAVTMSPNGSYTTVVAVPVPESEAKQKDVYYLQQRVVKVSLGITGYWIVTEGVKADEFVVTTGLINLTGTNLNDPKVKIFVKSTKLEQLTQTQLNNIISSNK